MDRGEVNLPVYGCFSAAWYMESFALGVDQPVNLCVLTCSKWVSVFFCCWRLFGDVHSIAVWVYQCPNPIALIITRRIIRACRALIVASLVGVSVNLCTCWDWNQQGMLFNKTYAAFGLLCLVIFLFLAWNALLLTFPPALLCFAQKWLWQVMDSWVH